MLKNIQILRFFAAFLVVLHHMQPPVTPFTFSVLPEFVARFGFIGVDIFFVISGFIMAQTTRDSPPGLNSSLRFLILRFGRIYIGWWPFFALFLFFMASKSEVYIWGSLFLWPQDLTHNLLPITWTLSFELYFYLCTALLITWNRRQASFVLGILAICIAVLNIWWLYRGLYLPENEALAKSNLLIPFYLSPLTIEFIAGFLLSDWLNKHSKQCLGCWLTGAIILFIAGFLYQNHLPQNHSGMAGFFHVCERSLLFGGFASCLVVCAVELERRKISSWTYLQNLGDASYSIYLSHLLFLIIWGKVFHKFQPQINLPIFFWGGVTLISIVIFSKKYYELIEHPLNNLLKRHVNKLLSQIKIK